MMSWIDAVEFEDGDLALMDRDDAPCICTFCDEPGVALVIFGRYKVHLCEGHAHDR